ncbi:Protein kinase domain - like 10 [Theobroma cacao]|nr:Protein kinase domain - like 10 [Theobroma cacao]
MYLMVPKIRISDHLDFGGLHIRRVVGSLCFASSYLFISFLGSGSVLWNLLCFNSLRAMKCFIFPSWDKKDESKTPKSVSTRSMNSIFTDREIGRSGSELNSQNVSGVSNESMGRSSFPSMSQRPSNLRVFTVSELKSATKNFSRSVMVGEGGFGCVYKGFLKSPDDSSQKIEVAVKQLAYLHEGMDFQIIFRDLKSSNILLDEQWNAKLSDFGLARLGPSEGLTHVSTAVVGTMGYAAPEYIQTGRLTSKIDVWSYGVFLYELITGRRPLDKNRPKNEQKLLDWVKPYLSDAKKFQFILDPRLKGKCQLKSAQRLATVANRCLVRNPKSRPKMSEVLEMVNRVVEASAGSGSPEPLLKTLPSVETPGETGRKHRRRIIDFRSGEKFVWPWTPKLVRAC